MRLWSCSRASARARYAPQERIETEWRADKLWSPGRIQHALHVTQMLLRRQLMIERTENPAISPDDIRHAADAIEDRPSGAVGFDEAVLGIGEQRERDAVFLAETAM